MNAFNFIQILGPSFTHVNTALEKNYRYHYRVVSVSDFMIDICSNKLNIFVSFFNVLTTFPSSSKQIWSK